MNAVLARILRAVEPLGALVALAVAGGLARPLSAAVVKAQRDRTVLTAKPGFADALTGVINALALVGAVVGASGCATVGAREGRLASARALGLVAHAVPRTGVWTDGALAASASVTNVTLTLTCSMIAVSVAVTVVDAKLLLTHDATKPGVARA
jgi:hypothetical protein